MSKLHLADMCTSVKLQYLTCNAFSIDIHCLNLWNLYHELSKQYNLNSENCYDHGTSLGN